MTSLIIAAGSPEAALLALWKEKQSASNHNAQLWRLVEKQRAMILGLNKDLERALKEKERYRKKLKDHLSQVPPLPYAAQKSENAVEREQSQSPALSERQDETSNRSNSAQEEKEHKSSTPIQESSTTRSYADSELASSPIKPAESVSNQGSSKGTSPTDFSVKPIDPIDKGLALSLLPSQSPTSPSVSQPNVSVEEYMSPNIPAPSMSPLRSHTKTPSLSLTQATPVIGGGGFQNQNEKQSQPLRKAPPAPLDLSAPNKTSTHLHQSAPGEHSDSDYDDIIEVDEIPIFDRGRRKTREEDDRIREALVQKDQEARSRSKKKKSKSKSKPPAEGSSPIEEKKAINEPPPTPGFSPTQKVGLPSSPRLPPAAGSINALLSPVNSEGFMVTQRSLISPPLMSPGLPMSPRPGDRPLGSPLPRTPKQSLASPPMSPRTGMPLSPRAPRQPIPLPPNTPLSFTSPHLARAEVHAQQVNQQSSMGDRLKPPSTQHSPDTDSPATGHGELPGPEQIYRGLVSDQYPGLLLPPNALPSIDVKVYSSRLRPSRNSILMPKQQEEDPVFILAIYARSDGKQLWRVEKTIVALPNLDQQLRSLCEFQGKLPDRSLFSGHAPAKIDARRAALNSYFDIMLDTFMDERAALVVCDFFSTDVIGAPVDDPHSSPDSAVAPAASSIIKGKGRKEGYLTKRGKNFGGWKARYFILEGPEFRYYEGVSGAHLGTIKLQNAQIGKQSQQQSSQSPSRRDDDAENQYRHAFLILEPKRKDSSSLVRHVLCAESDEERDEWVEALLQHVDYHEENQTTPVEKEPGSGRGLAFPKGIQDIGRSKRKESPELEKPEHLQGVNYDDTIAAEAPVRGPPYREGASYSPQNSAFSSESHTSNHPSISAPTNGVVIQNAEFWGNKPLSMANVRDKKRSIFGFRGRSSSDLAQGQPINQQLGGTPQTRVVFGIPLIEAVECSQPVGVDVMLPAVVYRCLEYLKARNAAREEGMFRLSGSNIVIKALKDRFNTEGDIKLLDGQYYDVHAVASLLKLYLRELPVSILTRELHLDFLKVLDLDGREKKIAAFNVLVHKLPRVNCELIQAICSFLIDIINNADVNKMTVRNVGIIFAPTLNIPAPLISMFLTDYTEIFGIAIEEANSPIHEITVTAPALSSEAIRSPRRQMFSDIPTPAYNQTSFQQAIAFSPGIQQNSGYDTGFIPLQPSYDAPVYNQQQMQGEGFGSLNGVLHPANSREAKQKRRESGILLVNMGLGGQRKGSMPRLRDEAGMVQEESAFE